jgi:hypothetical protein
MATSPIADSQWRDVSLFAIVSTHYARATEHTPRWSIDPVNEASDRWITVHHGQAYPPAQGWKIHVSAGIGSIEAVLHAVLPVLLRGQSTFKVISSLAHLDDLNQGKAGLSQIGKAITIYPNNDIQALGLAILLDKATQGMRGPAIPSDRPLTAGSLVYYRYGEFYGREMVLVDKAYVPAITAPDGRLIPDTREPGIHSPSWASDPFVRMGIAGPYEERTALLQNRYLIVATIAASARGTVARGIDIHKLQPCILKRAAHDGQMSLTGRDAQDYLRCGVELLALLANDSRFPRMIDLFPDGQDLILILTEVPGMTLARYIRDLHLRETILSEAEILTWIHELAQLMTILHDHGFVYCDLQPSNIIVKPDTHLCLIDFDAVYHQQSNASPSGLGTRGYMSPHYAAGYTPTIQDDIYSLGAICVFMLTGNPPSEVQPPDIVTYSTSLAPLITRCLAPDPVDRFPSMSHIVCTIGPKPKIDSAA